jgi:hypothetical protein
LYALQINTGAVAMAEAVALILQLVEADSSSAAAVGDEV